MNLTDNTGLPTTRITITWLLFGLCFGLLLYGVMLCQGYSYYRTYREDPLDLKLTVAGMLVTNAVILGLNTYACYFYAVDLLRCGSNDTLFLIPPCLLAVPLCIVFSIVLCQYVYIRRTYFMIPPRYKGVLVVLSVIVVSSATAFIIALTVFLAEQPNFHRWLAVNWLVSAGFGCSVLGDVGLACVLSVALHAMRTGTKRTDVLVNSIISNAFRSGIVTCFISTTCLLVAVFEGTTPAIIPLSLMGAKVYASVTLLTLNTRRCMAKKFNASGGSELPGATIRFNAAPQQSSGAPEVSMYGACGPVDNRPTINPDEVGGSFPGQMAMNGQATWRGQETNPAYHESRVGA